MTPVQICAGLHNIDRKQPHSKSKQRKKYMVPRTTNSAQPNINESRFCHQHHIAGAQGCVESVKLFKRPKLLMSPDALPPSATLFISVLARFQLSSVHPNQLLCSPLEQRFHRIRLFSYYQTRLHHFRQQMSMSLMVDVQRTHCFRHMFIDVFPRYLQHRSPRKRVGRGQVREGKQGATSGDVVIQKLGE